MRQVLPPYVLYVALYLGAGLGLAAVHLSRRALRLPAVEAPLRRSDLPWLAVVVASGGGRQKAPGSAAQPW